MTQTPSGQDVTWLAKTQGAARGIRRRVLGHVIDNNGGYLSQACSSADIFALLYTHLMKLGPSEGPCIPPPFGGVPRAGNTTYTTGAAYNGRKAPDLDRFFISPVHYALVLYATLVEVGRMDPEGLAMFDQDGSTVEMIGAEHSPGHEITCGSLGQGLSQVAGIAYARKRRGESGRNWILMSDGEFQIGQTWEAFEVMHFHGIDNVTIVVDVNAQQADGEMRSVMDIAPLDRRLEAFGAHVVSVDGHDLEQLEAAGAHQTEGGPTVILAHTNPCRDVSMLEERRPKLHYVRFNNEQDRDRYRELLASWQNEKEA